MQQISLAARQAEMTQKQILPVGSVEQRAKWALRLAAAPDVDAAPARVVDALWRGQRRFVGLPPSEPGEWGIGVSGAAADRERERMRTHDVELLATMQRAARDLLDRTTTGEPFDVTVNMKSITIVAGGSIAFRADPVAMFTAHLAWLLASSEAGAHVRKCPECGAFFYRQRRQLYCGARCTDKATWRKYSPDQKRRWRQKQYDKNGWTVGARSERTPR